MHLLGRKLWMPFLLPWCVPMFDTHLKMSYVKTKKNVDKEKSNAWPFLSGSNKICIHILPWYLAS